MHIKARPALKNHIRIGFSMGASILIARNLSKVVPSAEGELTILHELSLELNKGDSLAIVGASGSGKSTLLGLLAGLDLPSSGEVILAGQALSSLDEDQRARIRAEHVGFVFQSFQLLDSLNALENVMLPLELDGRKDARERARYLLERVGLGQRLTHSPRQLSGGEAATGGDRPRLCRRTGRAVCRRTHRQPRQHTGERISDLLFELNKESGTTLVLVTHDERLAHRCRRLIRLEAGLLVAPWSLDGTLAAVAPVQPCPAPIAARCPRRRIARVVLRPAGGRGLQHRHRLLRRTP